MLVAGLVPGIATSIIAADATTTLAASNSAFGLDLYRQLASAEGNLFFSPYSISACLAMTYAGARGETETQMASALHFPADDHRLETAFGRLQRQLNAVQQSGTIQLNIANGLWAQSGYSFLAPFLAAATNSYQARLEHTDFRTGAEAARVQINDWVSDETKGKIKDLFARGSLNGSTRLVLVNAMYFKGAWLRQFKERLTSDQPFFTAPDKEVRAQMMNTSAYFGYAELGEFQALSMPYRGGDLSMVILLPKEKDGLVALEKWLGAASLENCLAHLSTKEVKVFLPKFKLTQQFSLNQTLAAMGMPDAFSTRADFSGMDGTRDLFISEVVHKAFVDVNEEGTEAAAATGASVMALAVQRPRPMPIFRADHPFIFLIRDSKSGSILFLGRLTNPAG